MKATGMIEKDNRAQRIIELVSDNLLKGLRHHQVSTFSLWRTVGSERKVHIKATGVTAQDNRAQ